MGASRDYKDVVEETSHRWVRLLWNLLKMRDTWVGTLSDAVGTPPTQEIVVWPLGDDQVLSQLSHMRAKRCDDPPQVGYHPIRSSLKEMGYLRSF